MRRFQGQTLVIKYGGAAQLEPELKAAFARDITAAAVPGHPPGGGARRRPPDRQGAGPDGHPHPLRGRASGSPTSAPWTWWRWSWPARSIRRSSTLINTAGGSAVGLSGKDGRLLTAQKLKFYRPREDEPPEIIDIGLVGEVTAVNTALIRTLQAEHFIPVIAPVGVGDAGRDLQYQRRYWWPGRWPRPWARPSSSCSPTWPGSWTSTSHLVSSLTRDQALVMMDEGTIKGGMIPKVKCCLEALDGGVGKAHILDGRSAPRGAPGDFYGHRHRHGDCGVVASTVRSCQCEEKRALVFRLATGY